MMRKSQINYLNTDLDIISTQPFDAIHRYFCENGMFELRYDSEKVKRVRLWTGRFEVNEGMRTASDTPEKTIKKMLKVLGRMGPAERKEWDKCKSKTFNIGYQCGQRPWEFNNVLSKELVREIGKYGAGIEMTIYPKEK